MVKKFEYMFIRFDMIHEREKSPFSRTAAHIFVTPRDAPAICCMDGKRIQCLQIVSLHMPI